MKFSREFRNEDEARAREAALQASGYRSWRTRKPDGMWEVFWCYERESDDQKPLQRAMGA